MLSIELSWVALLRHVPFSYTFKWSCINLQRRWCQKCILFKALLLKKKLSATRTREKICAIHRPSVVIRVSNWVACSKSIENKAYPCRSSHYEDVEIFTEINQDPNGPELLLANSSKISTSWNYVNRNNIWIPHERTAHQLMSRVCTANHHPKLKRDNPFLA